MFYFFISIGQLSSDGVKGGRYLPALKFPKENYSQFHFQPLSNEETFEVIDEAKVQSSDTDIGPAEPVSASLVEIVEENSPNQAQNDDLKQPSQTKNSSLSSAILTFPQHKVHALQTRHRKPLIKLKQKSARVHPSSSKSKIVTRVSIPGKHRLFNISHAGSNWTKLLLSRNFTSLKHSTFRESTIQLSNNINVTDEARKRINQMERTQASSRDVLQAFISRMGLNVSSELHRKPSPRVGVPERLPHRRPSKNVVLNKGNAYLPPKKASLQRTSTERGGYTNFYIARKSSSRSDSLQSPSVIKGVPLEKKEKTSPLELKVFDSLSDIKFLNGKKNSTSKGGQKYGNNSTNLRILTSSLRDKDAHSLDNIVTGRDKSGLGTRPRSQVSPLSPSVNNTQTNATTTQLKNNKSQSKSGNIRDYHKIETNDKNLVNHSNGGSHNLTLVHVRKNTTYLNSTKSSMKPNGTFISSLDSNISLKHFNDLINFFNSFNSSSGTKLTKNITIGGNGHISNIFKNHTRNRIISQNLLRFLDFVHTKKTGGNYTSKGLELVKGHTHSNHDSIAEQIRKRLQMSIYRGWNKASKGRRTGAKNLSTSSNPSVKNKLTHSNDTMRLKSNESLKKSKEDAFELNVLQMMKNVSQKELLKLEGDIINVLSSARLWNLSQQNEKQNPGQQHQISSEKLSEQHKQTIHRKHDKQEHFSEEQLKCQQRQQQQLNKQRQKIDTFQHRNPKVGQQPNQTHAQRKYNQTNQQIEASNNGTTLHQHELEFESVQSHLQQTNHTRQHLKKNNMSTHSIESTTTVENCNLSVSVNTTKKYLSYGCYQTHNKLSPHNNGNKDFFSHSSNTSQAKTGALIKIVHPLHNAAFVQSPLARHSSARKIARNNTSPLRTGDGTIITKPEGFNVAKDVDDTSNISVQLDRDSTQGVVDAESISEGTTGSGVVELTEFVDQGKLRENVSHRYSFLLVLIILYKLSVSSTLRYKITVMIIRKRA